MAARHFVHALQVGKAGGADFQAVRLVRAVRDDVHAEFAFGMFHGSVGFAFGNVHAFGKQFEMVNQVFHALFHFGAFGRGDFVVVGNHGQAGVRTQPVGALFDDTDGLAHFRHAAEIAVVAVAVHADGDVKINLVVHFIRLFLTHVPFHAGTAQHHAGEAFLQRALRGNHADANRTLFPNTVVGEQGFQRVDVFGEAFAEGVDKVEHAAFAGSVEFFQHFRAAEFAFFVFRHEVGQVAVHAADAEIRGVHACAGHGFIQIHQLFAVAEGIQNRGHRADVQGVRTDTHQMVQDACYFGEHGADIFGANGDF